MSLTSAEANTPHGIPVVLGEDPVREETPEGRRFRVLHRRLFAADVVAGVLSGVPAGVLAGVGLAETVLLTAVLALAWPALAFLVGLYASEELRTWASGVSEAPKVFICGLLLSWPLFGLLVALDAPQAVAGALFASAAVVVQAGLARATTRTRLHRSQELRQRTLIVGSGVVARQVASRLQDHGQVGLEPVGYIDDDAHDLVVMGVPYLGDLQALSTLVAEKRIDRVVIAFSRSSHEELLQCVRVCRDAGVAVDIVPRLFEFLDGARTLDQIGGMPLLTINTPTFSPLSRGAKRALDIAVSGLALVALSPLWLIAVLAIKLESPGPVLFSQRRVGRHGRPFRIFKFRSMYVDAEERKPELRTVNDLDDGVMFKLYRDPRVTRVGRVLRRFSLDELPQLVNVLRGEMSLVGPRPLVLEEAAAMTNDWQGRRVDLRPGLTGPWQIAGRSHIPFHEMVRFDYQYVTGWSLARDVEILLATVPAVLSGRGAY